MKCKFCEQELPEGAEKCPNCGIPVRSNQKESPPIGAAMTTYRTPEQVERCGTHCRHRTAGGSL